MAFERVKYEKSPLAEVIFQVRFPNILRIASEEPSEFQEAIREFYPLFSVSNNETIVEINGQKQSVGMTKNYQFISPDGQSKVNLTNAFFAYSTLKYERWESFKNECNRIVTVFQKVYRPSIIQRVGLRYKDVITRSKWGLEGIPFSKLIEKQYLGILADVDENKVRRNVLDYEYEENNPIMAHRHFELIRTNPSMSELSFLMDCDYSVNGLMQYDVIMGLSEQLHDSSSRFLRSAITEDLHKAMGPVKLV